MSLPSREGWEHYLASPVDDISQDATVMNREFSKDCETIVESTVRSAIEEVDAVKEDAVEEGTVGEDDDHSITSASSSNDSSHASDEGGWTMEDGVQDETKLLWETVRADGLEGEVQLLQFQLTDLYTIYANATHAWAKENQELQNTVLLKDEELKKAKCDHVYELQAVEHAVGCFIDDFGWEYSEELGFVENFDVCGEPADIKRSVEALSLIYSRGLRIKRLEIAHLRTQVEEGQEKADSATKQLRETVADFQTYREQQGLANTRLAAQFHEERESLVDVRSKLEIALTDLTEQRSTLRKSADQEQVARNNLLSLNLVHTNKEAEHENRFAEMAKSFSIQGQELRKQQQRNRTHDSDIWLGLVAKHESTIKDLDTEIENLMTAGDRNTEMWRSMFVRLQTLIGTLDEAWHPFSTFEAEREYDMDAEKCCTYLFTQVERLVNTVYDYEYDCVLK